MRPSRFTETEIVYVVPGSLAVEAQEAVNPARVGLLWPQEKCLVLQVL